jgi:flagellar basal body rod protein FlgG
MKADSEGYITFENDSEPMFKIGVYVFANKSGLEAVVGGNASVKRIASGQAFSVNAPIVKQKSLEGSNVDIADEMTNLIKAQGHIKLPQEQSVRLTKWKPLQTI